MKELFTGRVFCSTLDGRFVEACQYVNGRRIGLLRVATRKHLEERGFDLGTETYQTVALANGVLTKSGTYTFDENEGNDSICEFHPGHSVSDCPHCLDEAVVLVCRECGITSKRVKFAVASVLGADNILASVVIGVTMFPVPARLPARSAVLIPVRLVPVVEPFLLWDLRWGVRAYVSLWEV